MIQDISPHKFDNHFRPEAAPGIGDTVFCFSGESVLCRAAAEGVSFPRLKDLAVGGKAPGMIEATELKYLFRLDGKDFFLAPDGISSDDIAGEGLEFEYRPLRALRKKDPVLKPLVFAAVTARHLNDWYRSCRFCGCCGQRLIPSKKERAMVCPSCGRTFYPRINPAVIVAVTSGDDILLTKYAGRDLPFYALVAGFTEIGESLEETVKREVREETGIEVTNIRYYKSQPWGFSGDILSGYFCEAAGNTKIHMDTGELKEAVWMPRKKVPGQPDDFSLTNEMMLAFRDGLV